MTNTNIDALAIAHKLVDLTFTTTTDKQYDLAIEFLCNRDNIVNTAELLENGDFLCVSQLDKSLDKIEAEFITDLNKLNGVD